MSTIEFTMDLIRDIIKSSELDKKNYEELMNRLIIFAECEKKNPTLIKKEISTTIPLLPPPPKSNQISTGDLIQL